MLSTHEITPNTLQGPENPCFMQYFEKIRVYQLDQVGPFVVLYELEL